MKKNLVKAIAVVTCMTLLTGCSTGDKSGKKTDEGKKKVETTTEINDLVQELKMKYAASEKTNYKDPIYNLPVDHEFVYENVAEEIFSEEPYEMIEVYSDADLKNRVDITIEEDYDKKTVKIIPNLVFNINADGSSYDSDGTWGSRSKFYLVEHRDLSNNKIYDKPMVTVFTIARDLDTPTMEQSVAEDGHYKLDWSKVLGAEYYEVYYFKNATEYAELRVTTEGTECTYADFKNGAEGESTYGEYEEVGGIWSLNSYLEPEDSYFVIARSKDGKISGMSNMCDVAKIAGTVPVREQFDVETNFEGDTAMVLPTHRPIEMLDGTVVNMLLDYRNVEIEKYSDTSFRINAKIRNLPMDIMPVFFSGMDYDSFMKDLEKVHERQDKLATKSVTNDVDVDIPHVPNNDGTTPENNDEETEASTELETEATTEIETEAITEAETATEAATEAETEAETETETEAVTEPETEAATEAETEKTTSKETENKAGNLETQLRDTVYANSALGEWIAIKMLANESTISLDGFPEASNGEYLSNVILEAYQQNPLIGLMNTVSYDYSTNSLEVTYVLDKEENKEKQMAAIQKAKEIADSIIKDGMSDFEKEEAINKYLCENGSYNDDIMSFINADGTIDDAVLTEHADSFLPYGILVENVGVCESYSEAFLMIARNAGLEAVIETGSLDGVNHEWNRVKIDGSWCILDVTNNDNEYIPNAYFNLSDETAEGILIPDGRAITSEFYGEYAASDNDKEYYRQKDQFASDADKAVSVLNAGLADSKIAAVRVDESIGESDVKDIVGRACVDSNITGGMYYYYAGIISVVAE